MSSIFNTYDYNTGNVIINPPSGMVNIDPAYSNNLLYIIPSTPLVDVSSKLHTSKHPIMQSDAGYVKTISNNGVPNDIYVQDTPAFTKNFDVIMPSNYVLDMQNNTYLDGTPLHTIDMSKVFSDDNPFMSIQQQERIAVREDIGGNEVEVVIDDVVPQQEEIPHVEGLQAGAEGAEAGGEDPLLRELIEAIENMRLPPRERERDEVKMEEVADPDLAQALVRRNVYLSGNQAEFLQRPFEEVDQFVVDLYRLDKAQQLVYNNKDKKRIIVALIKADMPNIPSRKLTSVKSGVLRELGDAPASFNDILNEYHKYIDTQPGLPAGLNGLSFE